MARNGDTRRGGDTGTHIITKTRPKTKRPSLYKVLLLNDDYTPMDFVVYVLERFFNKPPEEATRIMLRPSEGRRHLQSTHMVAETKVAQVTSFARQTSTRYNAPWRKSEDLGGFLFVQSGTGPPARSAIRQ
jgi:ATP-dependent Clp protease adaptor protein ClpS